MEWETKKDRLHQVLNSKKYASFEIIGALRVAISRCVMNNYKVWVWGAGERVPAFLKVLNKEKVNVVGVVDIDPHKVNTYINEIKILSPDDMFGEKYKDELFVFIWTNSFAGNSQEKMISELYRNGIMHWYKITGEDRNQICYFSNHDQELVYKRNEDRITDILENLYDEASVDCMLEYFRTYVENSTWQMEESDTANKYFYGGTIDQPERLYVHLDDEVWLNCGCHVGDTIFNYFRNNLKAKCIFAVDGEMSHIHQLEDNLSYLSPEQRESIKIKNTFIDKNTDLNDLFEGEKLSLINADIEGAELQLIQDMLITICKDRPVLALCLYHKADDAICIPDYLMNNLSEYCYIIRKYPSYYAYSYRNFELVLYAIPKERMVLKVV